MKSKIAGFFTNRNNQVLFGLLLLGIYVRMWGIDWGLPEIYEEATPMRKAWGFWGWEKGTFDFNPHFFNYPAFSFYIQFIVQLFYYCFGMLTGQFSSLADFNIHFQNNPSTVVLLSRGMTTLFGTATLIVTFLLCRKIWNGRVGLLATFFLTFNVLHVIHSQYVAVDIPLTFFVVVAYIYIYLVYTRSRTKDYFWAGLYIGLATGTKYTAASLLIPLILAHILGHTRRRGPLKKLIGDWRIVVGIASACMFFFVVSPFCLIDLQSCWKDISFERRHMASGHFGDREMTSSWVHYLTTSLRTGLGPLYFFSLCGFIYVALRRKRKDVLLLFYPLLYFLIVGSWAMRADRYLLPIVPFLCILAAYLLSDIVERIHVTTFVKRYLLLFIAVILILPSSIKIISRQNMNTRADTRTVTKEWIEENIPKKSLVALELYTPVLDPRQYSCVYIPMFSVTPELSAPFYDLRWYENFNYIVLSSNVYGRYQMQPSQFRSQINFYRELDNQFILLKEFSEQDGYGPTIKIYKKRKETRDKDSFEVHILMTLFEKLESQEVLHREQTAEFVSNLGAAFLNAGERERSMEILHEAKKLDPQNATVHYNIAIIYYEKGLLNEAVISCRKALELDPHFIDADYVLGAIYERTGQFDQAVSHYTKVLAARPSFKNIYVRLGETYEKQENFGKAKTIWESLLRMDPSNTQAKKRIQLIEEIRDKQDGQSH